MRTVCVRRGDLIPILRAVPHPAQAVMRRGDQKGNRNERKIVPKRNEVAILVFLTTKKSLQSVLVLLTRKNSCLNGK